MFLEALSRRNAAIAGIDRVAGPTLRSYPTSLRLPGDKPCGAILAQAQADPAARIRFESFPLARLVPLLPRFKFRSLLVIDNSTVLMGGGALFSDTAEVLKMDDGDEVPMTFRCTLRGDNVKVFVRYDHNFVARDVVAAFTDRFKHVFAGLLKSWDRTLADV